MSIPDQPPPANPGSPYLAAVPLILLGACALIYLQPREYASQTTIEFQSLPPADAAQTIREHLPASDSSVQVVPIRDDLFEIVAHSTDSAEAANRANLATVGLMKAFRESPMPPVVKVLAGAEPSRRPVRPNIPRVLSVAFLASLPFAGYGIFLNTRRR